ncbi:uncharacterized protein LAESUDRAFT_118473 [Laetiporus sulphureus 93-53]|uniref:Uncharacterized protein n=1 Tax=Laetiporus sulphureus 93-53 TaxID=1314785 RepID=A0A165EJK0_9APHY|nr:uncharacterized protein LAESUDRAFT_118473 [Laetiporus sulphureus 93-53]KZT07184.1 hypothetical protein LAESUDRAFT_118473 [Laetiporus sulphureus 93-53]
MQLRPSQLKYSFFFVAARSLHRPQRAELLCNMSRDRSKSKRERARSGNWRSLSFLGSWRRKSDGRRTNCITVAVSLVPTVPVIESKTAVLVSE